MMQIDERIALILSPGAFGPQPTRSRALAANRLKQEARSKAAEIVRALDAEHDATGAVVVWLLYREVSDQYGTSEVVGVFVTEAHAAAMALQIRDRRTWIKPMTLGRLAVRR